MKWIMRLCRVLVIVALLSDASFSRTVQPITYSLLQTVGDGVSDNSIQYGTHTAAAPYGPSSKSLSKHPSKLAHHYYDPPVKNVTIASTPTTTPQPSTTSKKPRKKNDYVPQVSYVRRQFNVAATTTRVADEDADTSTESIKSPPRVRKKGRWMKVRNEIPVNEDVGGEVVLGTKPMAQQSHTKMNQTQHSPKKSNRPAKVSKHAQNLSKSNKHPTLGAKAEVLKHRNQTVSESVKTKHHQKWGKGKSSSPTTAAPAFWHSQNSSFAAEQRPASSHSTQLPQYSAETRVEKEHDFGIQLPIQKPKKKLATGNVDQPYNPTEKHVDQQHNSASRTNADQESSSLSKNTGPHRKTNVTRKTTPIPKYREEYFKKPWLQIIPATTEKTSSEIPQQFAVASNRHGKSEKKPPVLTTEKPPDYTEPEPLAPDIPELEEESAEEEPGTHHESLTFSDTEKSEKTEEFLQDMEYPDDEDEEESEVSEEVQDPPATMEESPSKVLQKPIRYAYSADQNISESQTHSEPQKEKDDSGTKEKKGGGQKHRSAHHETEGEKAEEEYESAVEYDKGKKGHSDEENRKQHQEEERGAKKKLEEEGGHQQLHHVSSKGEKGTLFGESGNHKKGHSTKGSHNIHKKNEFLKKHEFYDEHHEDDEHKKYGDYHKDHKYEKDNMYNKKHKHGNYSERHKGKKGKHHNGHRFKQHKGHDNAFKHVNHYANNEDYGEGGHHSEGKKWKYEKSIK